MAAIVEHTLTKQQLLAAYLSVAYFENQAYGIQVASERYFSTTAQHLTLTQSAMLAGMVEDPSLYNPFVDPEPDQAAAQRRAGPDGPAALHHQEPGPGGRGQAPRS